MRNVHIPPDVHILPDLQKPYLTVPFLHPCADAVLGQTEQEHLPEQD